MNRFHRACLVSASILTILSHIRVTGVGQETTLPSLTDPTVRAITVPFVRNDGRCDERARFYARINHGTVFVTDESEIVYSLSRIGMSGESNSGIVLGEQLVGAQLSVPAGTERSLTRVSEFKGSDPSRWRSDLQTFAMVDMGEVYGGIELRLKARANNVEKLFFVSPGAAPEDIEIRLRGADALTVNAAGELEAATCLGSVAFTKPVGYQIIDGSHWPVEVAYALADDSYGFAVGDYDPSHTLVIDPLLASTFLGGSGQEGTQYSQGIDIALGPDGSVYIVGMTESTDFPQTVGAYTCTDCGDQDIFISRFTPDLSELISSAVIGGSLSDHFPWMDIGENGEVYIAGSTLSSDFPTTPGAAYPNYRGGVDVFISQLNPDLTTLLASTYLGGTGTDQFSGIAAGNSGVYVCGNTSGGYPTSTGAYDTDYNGGTFDFFISKLNGALSSLAASTYLGGIFHEEYADIDIDTRGDIIISGTTGSYDFPTTTGVYDESFNGPQEYDDLNVDCCVSKLSADLSALEASTFVGGALFDGGMTMCLDSVGNVFVGGHTESTDYPTTPGAFNEVHNGFNEFMLTKLSDDLTQVAASTFLISGGDGWLFCVDLAADMAGNLYTVGSCWGAIPHTPNSDNIDHSGGETDGFLAILDPGLTSFSYTGLYGGSDRDGCFSIVLEGAGRAYLAGYTASQNFPTTVGAQANEFAGGGKDAMAVHVCVLTDCDGDGVSNATDNCPIVSNEAQGDSDSDQVGDACDNCPDTPNPDQGDLNFSGVGDVCEEGFTPAGFWVGVDVTDSINVLFGEVVEPGITGVTSSATGPAPPSGYLPIPAGGIPFHDITTDAVYTRGVVRVKFLYDPSVLTGAEDQLRVFHHEGAVWEDCTHAQDLGAHSITASVSSLSTFVLAEPSCACDCHSDPACDGVTNVLDVVNAVNVAFKGAPGIVDPNANCPFETTDVDCTGFTNVIDVVKLVNVAFKGQTAEANFCDPCSME